MVILKVCRKLTPSIIGINFSPFETFTLTVSLTF